MRAARTSRHALSVPTPRSAFIEARRSRQGRPVSARGVVGLLLQLLLFELLTNCRCLPNASLTVPVLCCSLRRLMGAEEESLRGAEGESASDSGRWSHFSWCFMWQLEERSRHGVKEPAGEKVMRSW